MSTKPDMEVLLNEAAVMAKRRANIEVELRQLTTLEHKQSGDTAKLYKKTQILAEQLESTTHETESVNKSNVQSECEWKIEQEASVRMAESLKLLDQEKSLLKERVAQEKEKYNEELAMWIKKLS
jgi:hypothetical protein